MWKTENSESIKEIGVVKECQSMNVMRINLLKTLEK